MAVTVAPRTLTSAREVEGTDTLGGALRLFFSFPTPRLLGAKLLLFLALRPLLGPASWVDAAIVLAIAAYWPFQEWLLHTALLHWRPRRVLGVRVDPFAARAHRYHHRHPWILETTFLPPRAILVLIPVHIAAWALLAPTLALAVTGISAFTATTLVYEWVHYLVHTPYKPRSRYFRSVWRNHRLHHFKSERCWHAFTVPWVDTLMRTNPDPAAVPKSPTVRTLGVEGEEDDPRLAGVSPQGH